MRFCRDICTAGDVSAGCRGVRGQQHLSLVADESGEAIRFGRHAVDFLHLPPRSFPIWRPSPV